MQASGNLVEVDILELSRFLVCSAVGIFRHYGEGNSPEADIGNGREEKNSEYPPDEES